MKKSLLEFDTNELKVVASACGLKPYTADQIIKWIYGKKVASIDEMSNLSKLGRSCLEESYKIDALNTVEELTDSDGTKKIVFETEDGIRVESVYLPAEDGRVAVCLSTQAGCKMGCAFCRTAELGFVRNLTKAEIVDQFLLLSRQSSSPITNIVLMGMGEPLENFDEVCSAINVFGDSKACGIAKRRITVSTSGYLPGMEAFIKSCEVKLAISLNATTDAQRNEIMPINKKYPISELISFAKRYAKETRHRITFEYVLLKDFNDSMDDCRRLVSLLGEFKAKVNLIPFNAFEGSRFQPSSEKVVEKWSNFLYQRGIQTNIRASKGASIMAGCGQLAGKR